MSLVLSFSGCLLTGLVLRVPSPGFGSGSIWESSSLKVFIWLCGWMENSAEHLRGRQPLFAAPGLRLASQEGPYPAPGWPAWTQKPCSSLETGAMLTFSPFPLLTHGHKNLNPRLFITFLGWTPTSCSDTHPEHCVGSYSFCGWTQNAEGPCPQYILLKNWRSFLISNLLPAFLFSFHLRVFESAVLSFSPQHRFPTQICGTAFIVYLPFLNTYSRWLLNDTERATNT